MEANHTVSFDETVSNGPIRRNAVSPMKLNHHLHTKARDFRALRQSLYINNEKDADHMSTFMRSLYCAPRASILPVMTLLNIFSASFYEKRGANLQLLAFFIALARCVNIFCDPFVAQISDMFRGAYGRRKPFFFTGSFLYAMLLLMVLSPPDGLLTDSTSIALWFGFTHAGFYIAESFTVLPYKALGPELASSYDEKTTLQYLGSLFELCGGAVVMGLSQLSKSDPADDDLTTCGYQRCYSDTGTSQSGLKDSITGDYRSYSIFDVVSSAYGAALCTDSSGTAYSSEAEIFTNNGVSGPEVCTHSYYSLSTDSTVFIGDQDTSTAHLAAMAEATTSASYNWYERRAACISTYCTCVAETSVMCSNESLQKQGQWTGLAAAFWLIFALGLVTMYFGERVQLVDAKRKLLAPTSPVAAITGIFRNVAFTSVLPAFVLDHLSYTFLTTLILFWVKLVIQPEFQSKAAGHSLDCNQGRKLHYYDNDNPSVGYDDDSNHWQCSTNLVMGAILVGMGCASVLAGPLWYLSAIKYGKRATWVMSSILLFLTVFLMLAVGKGDVQLAISLSALPGAVLGSSYLGDAILADIIDYEEYLTGQRNEATFINAKNIIGKMLAIPVAALSLALLDSFGYISDTSYNFPSQQPDSAGNYVKTILVTMISIFSALSLYSKVNYPFLYKDQMDLVSDGIGLHLLGKASFDPITAERYSRADNTYTVTCIYGTNANPDYEKSGMDEVMRGLPGNSGRDGGDDSLGSTWNFGSTGRSAAGSTGSMIAAVDVNTAHPAELRKVDIMEHFPRIRDTRNILIAARADKEILVVGHYIERYRDRVGYSLVVMVGALSGLGATWTYFADSSSRSFLPVLMLCILLLATLAVVYYAACLNAAMKMKKGKYRPSIPLLEMMLRYREKMESLRRTATIDIVGIDRARKKMKKSMHQALHGLDSESDSDDDPFTLHSLHKLRKRGSVANKEKNKKDQQGHKQSILKKKEDREEEEEGEGGDKKADRNVYDDEDGDESVSQDSGSDDLGLGSDDEHGHTETYGGKKKALVDNWRRIIGMEDVFRHREAARKRQEEQEEADAKAGKVTLKKRRMFNVKNRVAALQSRDSDYLAKELIFELETISRLPIYEEEMEKNKDKPAWARSASISVTNMTDLDKVAAAAHREDLEKSIDILAADLPSRAMRHYTQWEQEYFNFILAQSEANSRDATGGEWSGPKTTTPLSTASRIVAAWKGEDKAADIDFGSLSDVINARRGSAMTASKVKAFQANKRKEGEEKKDDSDSDSDVDFSTDSDSDDTSDDSSASSSSEDSD